jgi:nucleotide-binding universal stress UspA family protein
MTYKTILVHCDAGPTMAQRLAVATELAHRFEAHLVGLRVQPRFEPAIRAGGGLSADVLYSAYQDKVKSDEAAVAAAFRRAANNGLSAEWRTTVGAIGDELAVQARYADLVVVSQHDHESVPIGTPADLPEMVAMATGRPVLVVPYIGASQSPGRDILLCWNASREAARAAVDALPLLRAAAKVTVLVIDGKESATGHGQEPGADVATWLARHGVRVTVQRDTAAESDVGSVILSRAADLGVDLVVMGVYGHSRLREMVLGGASRTLLASMTVPVLIAH